MAILFMEKVYAFVSQDPITGEENIMAENIPGYGWMPYVFSDVGDQVSRIRLAVEVARLAGRKYKIIEFFNRRDVTAEILKKHGN